MKSLRLLLALIVILMLASKPSNGQIQITSGSAVTPEQMVENIVGPGMQYSNAQYTGVDTACGIFTNGSITNLWMESGVLLTTGRAKNFGGPNTNSSTSTDNGFWIQLPDWTILYDPCILKFDFIPEGDTLKLLYIFGSEEYNEWVGSQFLDVMKIAITGPNPYGGNYTNKNIAIVPGTVNVSVKVNSVNNGYAIPGTIPMGPCTNCAYFLDNTNGSTLQYDGFTVKLIAWLLVVPCEQYQIEFLVAEPADAIYDSGIAIEENSFISSSRHVEIYALYDPPGIMENMVEGNISANLVFKLPNASYSPMTLCFDLLSGSGMATNGIDYEWIDNCVTFEAGSDSAVIHIIPIKDGIIEGDEYIIVAFEDPISCFQIQDTVTLIVKDYIDMITQTSPNTVICPGQEIELWVHVFNGFPPYTYNWQPGGFADDTIVVSPESTTYYKVTCVDLFNDTIADSVLVTVFDGNLNNILEFGFTMENNPFLPFDITGNILQDTVLLFLPEEVPSMNLVSSFSLPNCARVFVNGEEQFSGVSVQDFTGTVVYEVMAANGEIHNWLVLVEIQTGMNEANAGGVTILPNPSDGKFYIDISNQDSEPITMQILDLTGRIVVEIEPAISEKFEIDLSGQSKGMYFVRIKSGEGLLIRKIVIQ
jgi:hypothetical protein